MHKGLQITHTKDTEGRSSMVSMLMSLCGAFHIPKLQHMSLTGSHQVIVVFIERHRPDKEDVAEWLSV